MERPSRAEISTIFNSLVCVVKALEGQYTVIDLTNDSCVTGKIVHVDGFMNVDLADCVYYNSRGDPQPFETFFLKKRSIRYVHLPEETSPTELAEKQFESLKRPKLPKAKPTFKKKRSERYQKETVLEIAGS